MKAIWDNKLVRRSGYFLIALFVLLIGMYIFEKIQPNAYKKLLDETLLKVQQTTPNVVYEMSQKDNHNIIMYIPVDDNNQPKAEVYQKFQELKANQEKVSTLKDTVHVIYALKDQELTTLEGYQYYVDEYHFTVGAYRLNTSVQEATLLFKEDKKLTLTELMTSAQFDGKSFVNTLVSAIKNSSLNVDVKTRLERQINEDTLNTVDFVYTPTQMSFKFKVPQDDYGYFVTVDPGTIVPFFNPEYIYTGYKTQYADQINVALQQQLTKEQEYLRNLTNDMKQRQVGKRIAITFDDGPRSGQTDRVLDILKKYNVKATFYILGRNIAGNEELLKREVAEGHELGNHTWNHPNLTGESDEQIRKEVQDNDETIKEITGVTPKTVRVPYGAFDARVAKNVNKPLVNWSVDSYDWKNRNVQKNIDTVLRYTAPGDIILMHDIHPESVDSVETIISKLKQQGYEFVTVSELVGENNLIPNMIYFSATNSRAVSQ